MGADMNGLTNKEVIQSRNKYGRNTLTKVKKRSLFSLILSSLSDPIIKILIIVLVFKIIFLFRNNDYFETIGILICIILASTIGSFAEYGSEEALLFTDDLFYAMMAEAISIGMEKNL